MNKRTRLLVVLLTGLSIAACGGSGTNGEDGGQDGGDIPCDLTLHQCPEGQRCNQDQECVEADPLVIVTEALPDGRIGFGYNEQLQAQGGLVPYTWSIEQADAELSFLSIGNRGLLEGTPENAVAEADITVAVTDDGYGGGEKVTKTFTISIETCREGDRELCYTPSNGACFQGFRTCIDGQMSDCEAGDDPSADRRNCGADCGECDGSVSDGCVDGLCACGVLAVCTGADRCCDGECIDVSSDVENCGGCQSNCNQRIAHASGAVVLCTDGECDYSGDCDRGWLDCDGARDNGCEQQVRVDYCGACDVDCIAMVAHVPTGDKICQDTGSEFVCDYEPGSCMDDFGDCDADRSNGCEQYFLDTGHCGACNNECAVAAEGHLCITPNDAEPYVHVCGCRFDTASGLPEGCDSGRICCDHECRISAEDDVHCGVCDATCSVGTCESGACGCVTDGDCPSPSGGTSCWGASRCACIHAGDSDTACPPGQFCCDGTAGGSGGPGEEQDLGCCVKTCGWNDADLPCTQ